MKPVTVKLPPQYDPLVESLVAQMQAGNPEGRVVSRTHVLRYALRVAAQGQANPALARLVLEDEEQRGRAPGLPKPSSEGSAGAL